MCIRIFGCEPLDSLLILKNLFYLLRNCLKLGNVVAVLLVCDQPFHLRELNCNTIKSYKLCAISLCCSNRNLRSCQCIEYLICLTGNTASDYIYNCKCSKSFIFRHTHSCQCICGLSGLADHDNQTILHKRHLTVTELRCKLYSNRNLSHLLDHILSLNSYMPCRTARNNVNLAVFLNLFLCNINIRKVDHSVFHNRIQSITNCFRLLIDLFHHEMLKTGLLCCLCIPFDLCCLFLDLITIEIIEMSLSRNKLCKLKVSDIVYISCVFQDCRYIRCNISLAICNTDDHRAVFSGNPDLSRIILEHQLKCIRTTYTNHSLGNRIDRS